MNPQWKSILQMYKVWVKEKANLRLDEESPNASDGLNFKLLYIFHITIKFRIFSYPQSGFSRIFSFISAELCWIWLEPLFSHFTLQIRLYLSYSLAF